MRVNNYPEDTDFIRRLVRYAESYPAAVAKEAGVAVSTINRPFNGTALNRLGRATLEKLQRAYPDFPGWADERLGDRQLPFHGKPDADASGRLKPASKPPRPVTEENDDTVELAEFDVAYGLGGTFIHESPAQAKTRTFSRSWVRMFTNSPFDRLFWATGNGPSMTPAILDNDILLIDTMQQTPRMADQFWALEMHGIGMIKALRPGRDGAMRILSLNPDWPEETVHDGEMNVIGRVVAIVRKV